MTEQRRMIFHAPYPLNPGAAAASGIRPVQMAEAFRSLGYEVWLVTGRQRERAAEARRVRRAVTAGVRFDFCYSESSTMPMTMTEPHHLPLRPLLDVALFRFLRRHHIPVGHFLRDIFWAFPDYRRRVRPPQREVALAGYAYDMAAIRTSIDRLYLPSLTMRRYLDPGRTPVAALPPAHAVADAGPLPTDGLRIFYVGGLGGHYRLEALCRAVNIAADRGADVSLTLCTTEAGWAGQQQHYGPLLGDAVTVVHASGDDLVPLYERANLAALFVEPVEYWTFAMPVKMFEYLGRGRPMLASTGTMAGDFVTQHELGWTLPYDAAACADLLVDLAAHPERLVERRERVLAQRDAHTWRARAQAVAEDLTPK